jgi:ribosomal protein S6
MVNLQFYTIYVIVLVRITTTSTMQELNNIIQLADNIHRHVTLATTDIKLPSQKYVSFVSGHYFYWWRLFRTNVHNA